MKSRKLKEPLRSIRRKTNRHAASGKFIRSLRAAATAPVPLNLPDAISASARSRPADALAWDVGRRRYDDSMRNNLVVCANEIKTRYGQRRKIFRGWKILFAPVCFAVLNLSLATYHSSHFKIFLRWNRRRVYFQNTNPAPATPSTFKIVSRIFSSFHYRPINFPSLSSRENLLACPRPLINLPSFDSLLIFNFTTYNLRIAFHHLSIIFRLAFKESPGENSSSASHKINYDPIASRFPSYSTGETLSPAAQHGSRNCNFRFPN